MIIAFPNDNRGFLYHHVDLLGQVVHAYRDFDRAIMARVGDQRIFIQREATGEWLTGPPTPDTDTKPDPLQHVGDIAAAAKDIMSLQCSGGMTLHTQEQHTCPHCGRVYDYPLPSTPGCFSDDCPGHDLAAADDPAFGILTDQHIIVAGNPVDGLTFYGPYPEHEEALASAEGLVSEGWWIATLHKPL